MVVNKCYEEMICQYIVNHAKDRHPEFKGVVSIRSKLTDLGYQKDDLVELFDYFKIQKQRPIVLFDLNLDLKDSNFNETTIGDIVARTCGYMELMPEQKPTQPAC